MLPNDLRHHHADAFQLLTRDECVGIAAWLAFIVFLLDSFGWLR